MNVLWYISLNKCHISPRIVHYRISKFNSDYTVPHLKLNQLTPNLLFKNINEIGVLFIHINDKITRKKYLEFYYGVDIKVFLVLHRK